MAHTPKPERHKIKVVRMLKRWANMTGHVMMGPLWVDGIPHVAFKKEDES